MREENEILEELQALDAELKSFGGAHWFCPKQDDEDDTEYYDIKPEDGVDEDGISYATKQKRIQAVAHRHDVAYKFALVFGLGDNPMCQEMMDDYKTRLNHLLTECDKCVYNWHVGRKKYLKDLSEQFDDNIVAELSKRLDEFDFKRINKGLEAAQGFLEQAEPRKRNSTLLARKDETTLLALYEALCCPNYHLNDDNLVAHFNYVFEELQSGDKRLGIAELLPAMTRFIFSNNPVRYEFASKAWRTGGAMLTTKVFDWAVHDVLETNILAVGNPSTPLEDIERFWRGFALMLKRMDQKLITHSLRGMEVQPSIFFLLLQHIACPSEQIMLYILKVVQGFLTTAPVDFWSALGTISAPYFADMIFSSPGFKLVAMNAKNFPAPLGSPATSWIPPFISSLDPIHQPDACGKFLSHLLDRLQRNSPYPMEAKEALCCAGLNALFISLQTFTSTNYQINPSTSLIVIGSMLKHIEAYKEVIVIAAEQPAAAQARLRQLGMQVIKEALALDCKAISAEFYALDNGTTVQREGRGQSQAIWLAGLDIFRPGNIEIAKYVLSATITLTGLDEMRPANRKMALPKGHLEFNKDLHELWDNVALIYQRLSEFSEQHLLQLSQETPAARSMFAALVSADQGIYEAAIEVIKAMTGEASKQDAFERALAIAFHPVISSLTNAFATVSKSGSFGPMPFVIKVGREALKALCGSTGALRKHSDFNTSDRNDIFGWWSAQWRTLDVIFTSTEGWAGRIDKSKVNMEDFCRDSMEYAEALFNEYSIFASALRESSPLLDEDDTDASTSSASIRKVLKVICRSINGLVGMLRLRDSYLISVITSLMGKLLRTLSNYNLEVHEFAADFIKGACMRENAPGFKRTNLTAQQKAELQRALDEHQGVEIISAQKLSAPKKQGTIDSWTKSSDGHHQHESKPPKQGTIEAWSKSADGQRHEPKLPQPTLNVDKNRAFLDQLKAQQANKQAEKSKQSLIQSRRKAEEDRKKRDAEAIARAKALRAPTGGVKGEGSGLQSISGVAGKDHAPVRSEIMVGSSDEEDSDDDVDDSNALVKTSKQRSKAMLEYEEGRRRALQQMQQGPVRKTKIQRSAKDLRARVEPNMDFLYLEILNWDIFHEGDEPPSNNTCRRIDNKYLDLDLYKQTFAPLLISEVWRSLVTAKEENNFKPVEIKVLNRLSVDKFMEISTTMPISMNKDLKMSERDIVLISRGSDPMHNQQEPHCLARVDRTNRKKDILEVTFRVSRQINPQFLSCLVPNGKIFAVKIADMTTTQREYAALSSLEYYDLCTEVMEAKPSPLLKYGDEKLSAIGNIYNLNKGQSQAILSANDNDGFTLIQGPPGSGKTKTITAMVGSLLTRTLQQQAADNARARPPVAGQKAPPPIPGPKKKLLICAPSNAAVDELVVRLKEGVQPLNGPRQKINVIRLGRSDAINTSVKDVMLDELVRMKMEGNGGEKDKLLKERDQLHQNAAKVKESLNNLRPQLEAARSTGDQDTARKLQRDFDELKRTQTRIGAKIDEDKASGNTFSRQNEINRRRFQQEIIDGAHVLCATLSGSGHDMFKHINVEFETVIIDEAAQCIELSALIPLKYGCSKCILVGDPEQLPPTVLSRFAQSYGYEQSLFVRMQKNHPQDVHLLDTQYRMHPEISRFPSQQFYHSRLLDGAGMAQLRQQPWHQSSILGPYRFFDVRGVQTKQAHGHSFINVPELNAALKLYARLKADFKNVDFKNKIGIITTYKAQLTEMKARFERQYGNDIYDEIEFNTTDAFQGREREIIIFSCVRANPGGGIGFLGDIRRMNVGLTRAKSSLWVLGDSRSLQQGEFWNRLIEDSKSRDRYTTGDVMALLSKPTSHDWKPEPQSLGSTNGNGFSKPIVTESVDVEMKDISSASTSGRNTPTTAQMASRPRDPAIKQEARKPSLSTSTPLPKDMSSSKKRPLDSSEDSDRPKKVQTPKPVSALEEALQAQEAAKAARPPPAPRPVRPPGLAPRRPAPADPFIQRKVNKKR